MAAIGARRFLLLGVENADGSVTGVTATTAISVPVDCLGWGATKIFLRSVGTTSGGTIAIEESDWGPLEHTYSGTWSQVVGAINASSFSGGLQLATVVPLSASRYLRVRVATTITGGGAILASLVQQEAA